MKEIEGGEIDWMEIIWQEQRDANQVCEWTDVYIAEAVGERSCFWCAVMRPYNPLNLNE